MASGASTEPPPLPPPDYTPIPTEEWKKRRMPPLKGVIVDPEYPPTSEEALLAIKNHERNYDAQWQGQEQSPTLPIRNPQTSQQQQQTPSGSQSESSTEEQTVDPHRSSGSSKIFGRVAGDSEKPAEPSIAPSLQTLPKDAGVLDVLPTIGTSDFKNLAKQPCMRETFLAAGTGAIAMAGAMWIIGKKRSTIVNMGFVGFFGPYFTVFPICMYQRSTQKQNVTLVKETWEEAKAEKKAAWEAYKAKKKADDEIAEKVGSGFSTIPMQDTSRTTFWRTFWSSGNEGSASREG